MLNKTLIAMAVAGALGFSGGALADTESQHTALEEHSVMTEETAVGASASAGGSGTVSFSSTGTAVSTAIDDALVDPRVALTAEPDGIVSARTHADAEGLD